MNTDTDKEFDEFLLGSIDDGIQIPRTRKEWLDFIHRREQAVREEVVEEIRHIIEDHGHQQDDDTIWCNMDELLSALSNTKTSEHTCSPFNGYCKSDHEKSAIGRNGDTKTT